MKLNDGVSLVRYISGNKGLAIKDKNLSCAGYTNKVEAHFVVCPSGNIGYNLDSDVVSVTYLGTIEGAVVFRNLFNTVSEILQKKELESELNRELAAAKIEVARIEKQLKELV